MIDTDPSKGYVDLLDADAETGDSFKADFEWKVGHTLPGEVADIDAGPGFDFSKGYFKTELDGENGAVIGTFNAKNLTDGKWLDALGAPEPTACAHWKTSGASR